jgi:hypothetical protein
MNYGSLRSHFKALLNRSDITDALADTFIDQGITRIQRSLRIPIMEKLYEFNVTTTISSIVVPADYLEAISIYHDKHELERVPLGDMLSLKDNGAAGIPRYFCRQGDKILMSPEPSEGTVSINYYSEFPEMTTDTDENSLARVASDLIIYAALVYAADYFLDERAQVFDQKYLYFMTELQEQANVAELSGTLQRIRPSYEL